MKKTIAILLSLLMLFAFTACSKDETDSTENNTPDIAGTTEGSIVFNNATTTDSPAVYAVVSNDTPAIGEEVVIDISLANAPMFCSIDLSVEYNANALTVQHVGNCKIPNIVDNINIDNGKIVYSGLVMRSENVSDETLFKITATAKDAATGLQTLKVNGLSLLLALDADGNATVDRSKDLITTDILLTVQ